jgi:hypothetical protein
MRAPKSRNRSRIQGGNVSQTRAADDFATIRARMKELAREAAEASAEGASGENAPSDRDRRLKDRREGHPPPWAPTVFAKPGAGRR